MKKDIHPQYYKDAKISCSCGTTYTTGSTKEKVSVELCSACHPFYTGKRKLVDTAGRVDKFKARQEAAKSFGGQNKSAKKNSKKEDKDSQNEK